MVWSESDFSLIAVFSANKKPEDFFFFFFSDVDGARVFFLKDVFSFLW